MHRRTCLATAVVLLGSGVTLATAPGYAGPANDAATVRATTYAFHTSGFGSRVIGGQVPVGSGTTAYKVIGCTDRAGLSRTNDIADAKVPGLGTLYGVKTRVWTSDRHGVVASHATHAIAKLTLVKNALGSLSLTAIRSRTTAWHDASGFHATTTNGLGGITLTPATGPTQTFPAPSPGQPVTIPGLATVYAGYAHTSHDATGATALGLALRVDVIPTGTSVRLARSFSKLDSGLTFGVFHGHSNATRVEQAAGDIVHSGPNPLSVMPCQGTAGQRTVKSLADVDLGGQLVVSALTSSQRSDQGAHRAHGWERSRIARIDLGGGQLVVKGIVGQATVSRTVHGVHRSTQGSTVGAVVVNGQTETFPPSGVIEVPSLAELQRNVVTKQKDGVKVVALRLTLLDGSGAVVDLGEAALGIRRLPR